MNELVGWGQEGGGRVAETRVDEGVTEGGTGQRCSVEAEGRGDVLVA